MFFPLSDHSRDLPKFAFSSSSWNFLFEFDDFFFPPQQKTTEYVVIELNGIRNFSLKSFS